MNGRHFQTAAERRSWVLQGYMYMLSFLVHYNPTGTYQVIKKNYPDFPNWMPGFLSQSQRTKMYDFLEQKAERTGQPDQFARELLAAVPANPENDDLWLKTS